MSRSFQQLVRVGAVAGLAVLLHMPCVRSDCDSEGGRCINVWYEVCLDGAGRKMAHPANDAGCEIFREDRDIGDMRYWFCLAFFLMSTGQDICLCRRTPWSRASLAATPLPR